MKTKDSKNNICVTSLKLLGDFWTLRIIDALKKDDMRYCELQRAIDNVNPVTLTNKLQKLESTGLIKRRKESTDKISVTYSLTGIGKSAIPVLDAVDKFSRNLIQ